MSDDFFSDLLPLKPKSTVSPDTVPKGTKSSFDRDAVHTSGPSNHQARPSQEMPDLLGGEEDRAPSNAPTAQSFQQRSPDQTQIKEFELVVEETMRRFASGLKTVLEGFSRRLESVEALAEGLSEAAAQAREAAAAQEGVEAERFAALAKGVHEVRGELQLLKDNQELRAEVAELKKSAKRSEEASADPVVPEPARQESTLSAVSVPPSTPPPVVIPAPQPSVEAPKAAPAPAPALAPTPPAPAPVPAPQASLLPSAPSAPSAPQAPTPPPALETQQQPPQQAAPAYSQAQYSSLQPQYSAPLPPSPGPQYQNQAQQGLAHGFPGSLPQAQQQVSQQPAQQYTQHPTPQPQAPPPMPPQQGSYGVTPPSQYNPSPPAAAPQYSAPPPAKPFSAPPQPQRYSNYSNGAPGGNTQYGGGASSPYAGSYGGPTSNSGYPTLSQPQPSLPHPRRYGGGGGPPPSQYSGDGSQYNTPAPSRSGSNYSSHSQGGSRPPPPSGQSRDIPLEQVIDDVCNMGFSRHDVRAAVTELTDRGQAVDLNVVLDRLMNGPRR